MGALTFLRNTTDSAFFRDFRAPYLKRDTSDGNNIYIFLLSFRALSTGGIHFSIESISFFNNNFCFSVERLYIFIYFNHLHVLSRLIN